MHCGWWDHMVSLSSSGPAGVPLAILPIPWTPCQCTTYLLTQNGGWLLSRFILSVPSRYSAAFLCEDEGRLIPVLFCNAQEHLIACRQNPWPRKGATRPVLLGRRWGCGNQWQGDSLISVWAAVAPLPIRSKLHASLSATTPVSSLQPPLHVPPLSSSPFEWPLKRHHYSDYYCFIRLMYTEQSPGLFRSSFVLVFVFVGSWLCHGCNEEAYQLCANRPSGEDASMDNERQVGSNICYTLDLVQLNVLPSSPQCESLLFWRTLLCGSSYTHLWIVPALHIYKHASK